MNNNYLNIFNIIYNENNNNERHQRYQTLFCDKVWEKEKVEYDLISSTKNLEMTRNQSRLKNF